MKQRLMTTYALNLVDLAFTLFLVSLYGVGIEDNPFGAFLIGNHFAIPYKAVAVGLLFLLLYRLDKRAHRAVNAASWVLFGVFAALCVYHGVIAVMIL